MIYALCLVACGAFVVGLVTDVRQDLVSGIVVACLLVQLAAQQYKGHPRCPACDHRMSYTPGTDPWEYHCESCGVCWRGTVGSRGEEKPPE